MENSKEEVVKDLWKQRQGKDYFGKSPIWYLTRNILL